ncbi:MAG: cytidine deaminase [Spirochaetia bacterium]|nr:cytidine deaminase [Spirochaetia bacterium]
MKNLKENNVIIENMKTYEDLISQALKMLDFSYVPYSHFHVGAALLAKNGTVYTGCNIENSSFGATNCAERTAIFKAVSEGVKDFEAIAVVGGLNGKIEDFCPPCGICRQVMREFCNQDFKIILAKSPSDYKVYTLADLLPESFSL